MFCWFVIPVVREKLAKSKNKEFMLKCCFKLGNTTKETHEMLSRAFSDGVSSESQAYEWFKRFKEGRTSIEIYERSIRPPSRNNEENIARVRKKILEELRQTLDGLCETLVLSFRTNHYG